MLSIFSLSLCFFFFSFFSLSLSLSLSLFLSTLSLYSLSLSLSPSPLLLSLSLSHAPFFRILSVANFGVQPTKVSTLSSPQDQSPLLSDRDLSPEEAASYLFNPESQSHLAERKSRLLRRAKRPMAVVDPTNYDYELCQAANFINREMALDLTDLG